MDVSAVNCTPIKPQGSFGNDEDTNYAQVLRITKDLNDEFVHSDEIKKPLAAMASIGLAGLLAFAGGKKIGSIISSLSKNRLPQAFEGALKNGSKAVKDTAAKLVKENPSTKLEKAKNIAGKVIGKTEELARKGYKKLAYAGIPNEATAADKATSAFKNIAGWAGVATIFPGICSRDTDDDGVNDILQKGQNAYTGTETKFNKYMHNTSVLADLVETLT